MSDDGELVTDAMIGEGCSHCSIFCEGDVPDRGELPAIHLENLSYVSVAFDRAANVIRIVSTARPIPADDAVERVALVDRIKQLKAERKTYFDVEGDGVDVLLNDIWDYLEALGYSTRGMGSV